MRDLESYGRNGDNTMVHMSRDEVKGLAGLARSMGTELTINPDTGYPEAFNLGSLLPMAASLMIPGMTPLMAGALSGGITAATTGSLEKGLMSGLTAGSLSALGGSLSDLGAETLASPDVVADVGGNVANDVATTAMANPTNFGSALDLTGPLPTDVANPAAAFNTNLNVAPQLQMPATAAPAPVPNPTPTLANPATPATPNAPATPQSFMDRANSMFDGATDRMSQMGTGLDRLAGGEATAMTPELAKEYGVEEGAKIGAEEFMAANKIPLAGTAIGMGGMSALEAQDEMEGDADAMARKKKEDLMRGRGMLRYNYDLMNRTVPTNPYTGESFFAEGGVVGLMGGGRPFDQAPIGYLDGGKLGDGMSDDVPAEIDGMQPAALSDGEFVIPADVVSHLGNGSSDAGAERLYEMMDRIREARTGTEKQAPQIKPEKYLPA